MSNRILVDTTVLKNALAEYKAARQQRANAFQAIREAMCEVKESCDDSKDKAFFQAYEKIVRDMEVSDSGAEDVIEDLERTIKEISTVEGLCGDLSYTKFSIGTAAYY